MSWANNGVDAQPYDVCGRGEYWIIIEIWRVRVSHKCLHSSFPARLGGSPRTIWPSSAPFTLVTLAIALHGPTRWRMSWRTSPLWVRLSSMLVRWWFVASPRFKRWCMLLRRDIQFHPCPGQPIQWKNLNFLSPKSPWGIRLNFVCICLWIYWTHDTHEHKFHWRVNPWAGEVQVNGWFHWHWPWLGGCRSLGHCPNS